MVLNQLFCFIAVFVYRTYKVEKDPNVHVADKLWIIVTGLFFFSMINFALFLSIINRKYVPTFFSTKTGKQFAVDNFEKADTDDKKFDIFTQHPSYYDSILNELLMPWLNDNWERWEDEKPDFFTVSAIALIPVDILPVKYLESIGGKKGRKASLALLEQAEATENAILGIVSTKKATTFGNLFGK